MRWPKTEWGIKVINFKERYGMTMVEIARAAGVKLPVLRLVIVGKTPGYEIVDKVDAFIEKHEATHQPGPFLKNFPKEAQM